MHCRVKYFTEKYLKASRKLEAGSFFALAILFSFILCGINPGNQWFRGSLILSLGVLNFFISHSVLSIVCGVFVRALNGVPREEVVKCRYRDGSDRLSGEEEIIIPRSFFSKWATPAWLCFAILLSWNYAQSVPSLDGVCLLYSFVGLFPVALFIWVAMKVAGMPLGCMWVSLSPEYLRFSMRLRVQEVRPAEFDLVISRDIKGPKWVVHFMNTDRIYTIRTDQSTMLKIEKVWKDAELNAATQETISSGDAAADRV